MKISDVYVQHVGGGTAERAKIDVHEKEDGYPEPGCLARCPRMALTSGASTGLR